jgi:DNA mismatch repair protein MSH6
MDELGRGTSTFDGTAIASATVKHLVERSQCLSLFATHYHSLLDEWKKDPSVVLGHMECAVGNGEDTSDLGDSNITFLYTLGPGACPKSFGINVARLAGLPEEVLRNAKRISADFELEMSGEASQRRTLTARTATGLKEKVKEALEREDWKEVSALWMKLRES